MNIQTLTPKPVLPPGVSTAQFDKAIQEFRSIVGAENLFVDLESLAPYSKIMIPESDAQHQPSGAVAARSVEDVQRILAVCSKYRIPIWTISTGRNFGYGSAAPATSGQMVLDLRKMNRILDVDAEMCTALVEPGVTYTQLQDYITEKKLPLWLSFPASGPLVGPVGNTLDRGAGYNRCGEHAANFCGLEVVLADGQVVRTGMGGVAGGNTWQNYRWGYGPWIDGLFLQSNFGVVTKMGLWLMPAPETHKFIVIELQDEASVEKALDVARRLRLHQVIENGMMGTGLYGLATIARRQEIYPGPGVINDAILSRIQEVTGGALYMFACTLYGTEAQVECNFKIVQQAFAGIGKLSTPTEGPPRHPVMHLRNVMTGKLEAEEFGLYNFKGGGGSAWFSPVIQAKGSEFLKSLRLNRAILIRYGFDYMGGVVIGSRHCDHIIELAFDRTNPDEMKRAHDCFDAMVKENAAAGFAPYRVNTGFMREVADVYGPAQKAINKKLKRALDPKGILAPGKSGIF